MKAERYLRIKSCVESWRILDILRFILSAPVWVREMLEHNEEQRRFFDDQLRRREEDLRELRGRRSVELEAAGREGFRQGQLVADIAEAVHVGELPEPGPDMDINLGLVYAAAIAAEPTVVTGKLAMVGRARST